MVVFSVKGSDVKGVVKSVVKINIRFMLKRFGRLKKSFYICTLES